MWVKERPYSLLSGALVCSPNEVEKRPSWFTYRGLSTSVLFVEEAKNSHAVSLYVAQLRDIVKKIQLRYS